MKSMQGENRKSAYPALILSMVIFGTIGIFRRQIDLPSETLAFVRGILGSVFLLLLMRLTGRRFQTAPLKGSLALLVLTGAMIGFNWILLFEAYNYTTVAVATLCYYMQPVIVLLVSPFLFKEAVTLRKILCVAAALAGMVLVSGAAGSSGAGADPVKGIVLGLGAAALYACVVLLNKKITGVPLYEKTIIQLFSAAAALIPYMLSRGTLRSYGPESTQIILLLTVGIIHTGLAYALYFGAVEKLPVQTAALFGYIDPVTAVLLSALFLHEPMTPAGIAGAVLILGALLLA
jgi:RarD protein